MSNEVSNMPEIKPGYVIEDTSGKLLLVVSPKIAYEFTRTVSGYLRLDVLTTNHWAHSYKIVRIYGCEDRGWLTVADLKDIAYDHNDRYVLWSRPDPVKEMTISELEEHFGCKVKIVKDK